METLAAIQVASKLLESSDWKFSTTLEVGHEVNVYGTPDWCDETFGGVVIDWELEFDVRQWGVKDITVTVLKLEADIDLNNAEGQVQEHVEINWPQPGRPEGDSENPTPALARHMAVPQWNVQWKRMSRSDDSSSMVIAVQEVNIDLKKHLIEIEF